MIHNFQMLQTETVINAIKTMNIDLLDVILDKSNSYLDVPIEIFLKELSKKFEI